jgi:hypothetical protein
LAQKAYENFDFKLKLIQHQLIGVLIDGLLDENIRNRLIRENHKTFEAAVVSASYEQNAQLRCKLRTKYSQHNVHEQQTKDKMVQVHTENVNMVKTNIGRRQNTSTKCCSDKSQGMNTYCCTVKPFQLQCRFCQRFGHKQSECKEWLNLKKPFNFKNNANSKNALTLSVMGSTEERV